MSWRAASGRPCAPDTALVHRTVRSLIVPRSRTVHSNGITRMRERLGRDANLRRLLGLRRPRPQSFPVDDLAVAVARYEQPRTETDDRNSEHRGQDDDRQGQGATRRLPERRGECARDWLWRRGFGGHPILRRLHRGRLDRRALSPTPAAASPSCAAPLLDESRASWPSLDEVGGLDEPPSPPDDVPPPRI